MGNVKSNLNIFICGKTLQKENLEIINHLFPKNLVDEKLNNSDIKFIVKESIKSENNFSISWKCFILDNL